MARGRAGTLSKQALELQSENTQIKEELAFLQKLVSDTGKQGDDLDPAALGRARAATMRITTACSSCAAASPIDDSSGQLDAAGDICADRTAGGDHRRCPTTSRTQRAGAEAQIQVLSAQLKGRSASRRAAS